MRLFSFGFLIWVSALATVVQAETKIWAFSCLLIGDTNQPGVFVQTDDKIKWLGGADTVSVREVQPAVFELRDSDPLFVGYLREIEGSWKFIASNAGIFETFDCINLSKELNVVVDYYASLSFGEMGDDEIAPTLLGAHKLVDSLREEIKQLTEEKRKEISQLQEEASKFGVAKLKVEALQKQLVESQDLIKQNVSLEQRLAAALAAQTTAMIDGDAVRAQLKQALLSLEKAKACSVPQQELLRELDVATARLAETEAELSKEQKLLIEARIETQALSAQVAQLRAQVAQLRAQMSSLQALLDDAAERDQSKVVQLDNLGNKLNAALAQLASEKDKLARAEAEKRKLLEPERDHLGYRLNDLEKYRSEFLGILRDVSGAGGGVRIFGDNVVFSSEALFRTGSSDLTRAGQDEIVKIMQVLREVTAEIPSEIDWVLQVDGHTDNVPLSGQGEFKDNWELSQARALSVVRFMVNFLEFEPRRLSANGFGQYQPINTDDTDEARAQNRRIELKLTEK